IFNGGKDLWPKIVSNAPFDYKGGTFVWTDSYFDLPAIVIVAIITTILVIGIKESANFNAAMVVVKLAVVFFVIGVGAFYVNPENWKPFAPYGYGGVSLFSPPGWGPGRNGHPAGARARAAAA